MQIYYGRLILRILHFFKILLKLSLSGLTAFFKGDKIFLLKGVCNMQKFIEIYDNIYRLSVPFANVLTSVFAVVVDGNCIIIDSATTERDVDTYILPAIREAKFNVKKILASHEHADHAGGLPYLAPHFPDAEVCMFDQNTADKVGGRLLSDGEVFYDCIKVLHLPGHSSDSLGILDTRTGVLLTFDSLQLFGVGKWVTSVYSTEVYKNSIDKIRSHNVLHIAAAHDYAPLGYFADTQKEIDEYLNMCLVAPDFVKNFLDNGGQRDAKTVANEYLSTNK